MKDRITDTQRDAVVGRVLVIEERAATQHEKALHRAMMDLLGAPAAPINVDEARARVDRNNRDWNAANEKVLAMRERSLANLVEASIEGELDVATPSERRDGNLAQLELMRRFPEEAWPEWFGDLG